MSEIKPADNGVLSERELKDSTLRFVATELRKAPTGIHGKLRVYDNGVLLASSVCNIEKAEQRTTVAREAYKGIQPNNILPGGEVYEETEIKHDLMMLCDGAWPAWMEINRPQAVVGDPMRPMSFLASPHVVEGGGTILFGDPGSGKSITAMLVCVAVDSGTNGIWGVGDKGRRALYVNLERGEGGMERRLGHANQALGLEAERPLFMLNARGRSLKDVYEKVVEFVEAEEIEFVVLDSISRAGMGDLTENQPANYIMDSLNAMSATWLGIGHPPRGDSSHIYGSHFFDAAADIVLGFKAHSYDDTHLGIQIEATKVNDVPKPLPMYLSYTFDTFGLKEVAVSAEKDHPDLAVKRARSVAHEIEDYLKDYGASSADQIAHALEKQRPNIVRELKAHSDKFVMISKVGRSILYGLKYQNTQDDTGGDTVRV